MMKRGNVGRKPGDGAARRGSEYELLRFAGEVAWLRTLTHVAPVGIARFNAHGICEFVNECWSEMTGYTARAARMGSWEMAIHPDDRLLVRAEWERCEAERRPFRFEHRFLQPGGRVVWAVTQVAREVDGRGRVTGYTGMSTDITELQRMREELSRSNGVLEGTIRDRTDELHRVARIVEVSDDAIISSISDGTIATWNRGAERIFGYSAAEMIGQSALVLVPEDRRQEEMELNARVFAGEDIHHVETARLAKNGAVMEVLLSLLGLRDDDGKVTGTSALVRDLTDGKRAEHRMQRLSWQLLRIQDDERRRLARELHDSTAQSLAALAMNLSVLVGEDSERSDDERRQLLRDSIELAELATGELRTTSYLLHPPLLDERGLSVALGWLATGFSGRSGINVTLEIAPGIARLPIEIETALFRVAQESLHNVHRHSRSKTVAIQLSRDAVGLVLAVRDHGCGPPPAGEMSGVGIAGMKERMLQVGGSLAIESNEPGTAVIARLPVVT